LGLDAGLIELCRKRQPTISEHQQTIAGYLRLRPFDDAEVTQLEQSLFEEACEGRTAASDGQRFSLPRRILQQTYSNRFRDFALEFYTFVADNYAPFYSLPIECTDRDAAFVLDGLLYNESELEIEEHYTDTHGYTEINLAAFAMLGLRFCPRTLKGLPMLASTSCGINRIVSFPTFLISHRSLKPPGF
jgi:Tn3 transposase DDE domain